MTRWKASLIHLGISAALASIAFALLYLVYYPQPYFAAAGADQLVLILLGVDVILGPLLTLIVFKSGKKTLKFDLSTIAAVQIAALVYGLHTMWLARPVFIVGAVDRLVMVYASELTQADLDAAQLPEFRKMPVWGPKLVGTVMPTDPKEQFAIAEQAFAGGKDVEKMPKYYVPYIQAAVALTKRGQSLEKLSAKPGGAAVQAWLVGKTIDSYVYLPLVGRSKNISMVFDRAGSAPVQAFQIDPW
jgi:hypothetical protein